MTQERPPLTDEEIGLIGTPDDELAQQCNVFSFDTDKLKSRIESGERWQQLLQAHLYLDHVITRLVLEALKNPEAINASRMSFSQKVGLVDALGLAPRELLTAVEKVTSTRNSIAHRLDFELSEQVVTDIKNVTPKHLRDAVFETRADKSTRAIELWEVLYVIVLQLDITRQQRAFERLSLRKSQLRLRSVLDKTPRVTFRE